MGQMGQVKISPLLASVLTESLPDPTAISGEASSQSLKFSATGAKKLAAYA